MKRWAGCPQSLRRYGMGPIALVMGSLAVASVSTPAFAGTPSFTSQSAGAIVATARAAMERAGPVSATGAGSVSEPGAGKIALKESDYTAQNSGSQLTSGAPLTSDVLDVGGAIYVKAGESFWSQAAGLTDAQASQVANRWIQIPSSSPLYVTASSDLTKPSLIKDLFHAKTFHKGKVQTVDGVKAIKITYTNSGEDAGPVTLYVATGGKHLPVSATIDGLDLRLGSWGVRKSVSVPQGAVSLSTVVPASSTSGTDNT
jgi:hypothetical protein